MLCAGHEAQCREACLGQTLDDPHTRERLESILAAA